MSQWQQKILQTAVKLEILNDKTKTVKFMDFDTVGATVARLQAAFPENFKY